MSELDKDGHTPVVIRKTTEEVMKEQGKGWYLICFQGLKKALDTGLTLQPRNDRDDSPKNSWTNTPWWGK